MPEWIFHVEDSEGWTADLRVPFENGKAIDCYTAYKKQLVEKGFVPVKARGGYGSGKPKDKVQIKQTASGFVCPKCGSPLTDQRGQVSANGKPLPHFKCTNVAGCPGKQPNKTDPTKFWPYSIWADSYEVVSG